MKKTGFRNSLVAVFLIAALVLAGTGCDRKISSSDTTNKTVEVVDPLSYGAVDAKMREYTFGINEYMREHSADVVQKTKKGTTPGGVPADCVYTLSPDSKYESLQMEKSVENGVQYDEYFNMGDSIFITRTTVYNDGGFEPVDKYYIVAGALYKVDITDQTVTKLVDLNDPAATETSANIDIYLSFEEIRSIYG